MRPSKRTSLFSSIFRRLGKWHTRWVRTNELGRLKEGDLRRIASDAGVDAAGLWSLAARGDASVELLSRRLAAHGIGGDEIARLGRAILPDMERVCTHCEDKERCARDLNLTAPPWPSYCPNAELFREVTESRVSKR